MRNKNKRVRFAEADSVGSPRCESYACEMVNNVKTPVELERPKTSEYKFYRKALEEVCHSFCCNEGPGKEDSCAKMEEKKHSKEISRSSWSRHWEQRSLLPTGNFSPLCQSASPYASQIPASIGLNLCATEPRWPFISVRVPQNLASKDTDVHEITPNSPSTVSQVPKIVTSRESGVQYPQGQVFSIKRQRPEAIPRLLERIGIQKDGVSNTRMLSSISNKKHFNGDNTNSDDYVIDRSRSSIPKHFYDNDLSRSFNVRDTYYSELGSPTLQGKDSAIPIFFSSSGSLVPPMVSTGSSLGWPAFFTWNAEELCNGQYRVDEMMLDSIRCASDHKLLGVCEPFHVTRPTMDCSGMFTEIVCPRRSKYYTSTDMPSDFALLDCKNRPYVHCRYLNEPLLENDTYNHEEMDNKEISNGLEKLDSRSYCRHLLLDSNYRKEAPDELVPKSSIALMASESFPFQNQSYTLQPGLLPGIIRSRDSHSSYNMVRPWAEHLVEDDNFQYDEESSFKCSVEKCHYLPQLESHDSIRPYDGSNVLLYTRKHMSDDVLCASWKYLLPSPGVSSDVKNPLTLDYSLLTSFCDQVI
ncbi:uncharacterized protein LOC116252496 isoform X3 [Nymphaea colorata]|uniref:uncharacterized protein LOC116252496 isoform X3 n=1 Tax=Nymphaea colorata TaxID=210225 RepID=UPI00214EDE89|nr:uncharacterized protein LOC116252496 isoform X3 [Nymphaea colorata]